MTTDPKEDGAEGATDTPALVVCDFYGPKDARPHNRHRNCVNPRPAQPEPPAPQSEGCKQFVSEQGDTCDALLPCATHPAPLSCCPHENIQLAKTDPDGTEYGKCSNCGDDTFVLREGRQYEEVKCGTFSAHAAPPEGTQGNGGEP